MEINVVGSMVPYKDPNGTTDLRFNLENAYITEVELDKSWERERQSLSKEDIASINASNDAFKSEKIIPPMMTSALNPCTCRRDEIMRRASMNGSIANVRITQEDIDCWEFSVVVVRSRGTMMRVAHRTMRCKRCGRETYWSDSTNYISSLVASTILANEGYYSDLQTL